MTAPDVIAGPSGGALGDGLGVTDRETLENHPGLAKKIVTIGKHRRAGYQRERWQSVDWDAYRAQAGVGSAGPWSVVPVESLPDSPTAWVCEAEGLPFAPGWHTALMHEDRGLVMSDVPAEIAGALPFLDAAEQVPRARVLVAGLGLGIVPARLLAHGDIERIDVIEIDADVIRLVTGGAAGEHAPNAWAADPRLHVWHGDALTWKPVPSALDGAWWHACFFDIWDTVSPRNLPSMRRLHRRFARRVAAGRMWSWERAECEAMLRRGQVLQRPGVDRDGAWRYCGAALVAGGAS